MPTFRMISNVTVQVRQRGTLTLPADAARSTVSPMGIHAPSSISTERSYCPPTPPWRSDALSAIATPSQPVHAHAIPANPAPMIPCTTRRSDDDSAPARVPAATFVDRRV
jgi:hypothetical protein